MLKKITALFASVCIAAAAISSFTVTASAAEGTNLDYSSGVVHISKPIDLQYFAEDVNSGSSQAKSATVILDNDINLYDVDYKVNIGNTEENSFNGVFDGNGYTISNLEQNIAGLYNGLFGFTDGATIKNLTIEGANISALYAGGIVVTSAKGTEFMNISVKNSKLELTRGNVIPGLLTLFTDGLSAGAIAGEASAGTLMYNCESVDTVVKLDSTHLTDALTVVSNYYAGGLVGVMKDSHIEYSRVLSEESVESGKIYLTFQSVADLVNNPRSYVGGIAGKMGENTSVTDSFSNAYVAALPEFGVISVGYHAFSYTGGIAGVVSGSGCKITRSHYSGKMEQHDYASLINIGDLFEGEQTNQHLGGTVGVCLNKYITPACENVYYNSERLEHYDTNGEHAPSWEKSSYIGLFGIGTFINNDIPLDGVTNYNSTAYAESSNFAGFDFEGNAEVYGTKCSELFKTRSNPKGTHYNKWVMKPYNYGTENTTMPVHAPEMTIYSNKNNAFTDQNPESMPYVFTTNSDNTVTLPSENDLTRINPHLNNSGFIGIAFVSERDTESETAYTCDMLYEPGSKVSRQKIDAYSKDPDKKIYGVWCQAYTVGAQLGLNNTNKGIRVLTAVNTDLLENIGLTKPDQDYFRGATFTVGGNKEYMIQADSTVWHGESYKDSFDNIDDSKVKNAKVFSIFAAVDESDYTDKIKYQGDILYNGINKNATEGLFDFLCNPGEISVQKIAQNYISDLEAAGRTEDEHYGLTDEAYNNLMTYAGKTE